jgi:6-phosphogluconolactonase/glucosamine-6-phosphate isomerase/deaminase
MLAGKVTTQLPASFLQLHPNAEVWLDRDAARRIRDATVIRLSATL